MKKDFSLGFKKKVMYKDIRLALEMGQTTDVTRPLSASCKGWLDADLTFLMEGYDNSKISRNKLKEHDGKGGRKWTSLS